MKTDYDAEQNFNCMYVATPNVCTSVCKLKKSHPNDQYYNKKAYAKYHNVLVLNLSIKIN